MYGRYDQYTPYGVSYYDFGDSSRLEDGESGQGHGRDWDPSRQFSRHHRSDRDRYHRRRERSRPRETGRTRPAPRPERDPFHDDLFMRYGGHDRRGGATARAGVPMDYELHYRVRERVRLRMQDDSRLSPEQFDRLVAEIMEEMEYVSLNGRQTAPSRVGRGERRGGEGVRAGYDSYYVSFGPGSAPSAPNGSPIYHHDSRQPQQRTVPKQPFRYEYVGTTGPDGEIIDGYGT